LAITHDIDGICCYLSLLAAGHAVHLADPDTLGSRKSLQFIDRFRPHLIIWSPRAAAQWRAPSSYQTQQELFGNRVATLNEDSPGEEIFPQTALLLSTSGSTGDPKVARLSAANINVNARQIVDGLRIAQSERHLLSLPLHFSYGASVLHSSLYAGSAVLLVRESIVQPSFWRAALDWQATTLPCVPAMLSFMATITAASHVPATLRKLTVAGAPIPEKLIEWLIGQMLPGGIQVYSMYGMTEAGPRMSILPHESFASNPGSVGRAVRGAKLMIQHGGAITFSGPNVMLGYATRRADLGYGDQLSGVLQTGDLGRLNAQGNLWITGRVSRICKLLGKRCSLEEIERCLSDLGEIALTSDDVCITVHHRLGVDRDQVRERLTRSFGVPKSLVQFRQLPELPRNANGKVSYSALQHNREAVVLEDPSIDSRTQTVYTLDKEVLS
jgi:acyl-coenzyme A synthetase/AMP-(fatty) acid ligase